MQHTIQQDPVHKDYYLTIRKPFVDGVQPETEIAVWLPQTNDGGLDAKYMPQIKGAVLKLSKETVYLSREDELEVLQYVQSLIDSGELVEWGE